jgi:hypothetical protein
MLGRRMIVGMIGSIYATFLILTYVELSKVWYYIGFWYSPAPLDETVLTIVLVGILGFALPATDWTVVGFAKWLLYFVLFVPAIVIPTQQGVLPQDTLRLLMFLIFGSAAMLILFLRDGQPFPEITLSLRNLNSGVIIIWIFANIAISYVFWGSMNLAGLSEVYEQRNAAGDVSSAAIAYVMGLMSGAINPFLLVIGMAKRRFAFIVLAVIGQVLIYSTLAGKVVLGGTLLTIGVFFVFRHGRVMFGRIYATVLSFGILGPFISAPSVIMGGIKSTISSLIYMRILVLPGVLVGVYSEYFLSHPVTRLSHSLIGRPFSVYPYGQESVGQVVGRYVTPVSSGDVNNYVANFIAGDGIAGFGTWGVPVIFVFAAGWLWLLSKMVGSQDRAITCAMLMAYVVSLANTSLFTSILTGGGAAVGLLMYLNRCAENSDRLTGPMTVDPALNDA